jgi:hypothetical protein
VKNILKNGIKQLKKLKIGKNRTKLNRKFDSLIEYEKIENKK